MKGPSGRLKFDVRRLWECPICHRRERTAGTVVSRQCICQVQNNSGTQTWMLLIDTERSPKAVKIASPAPSPPLELESVRDGECETNAHGEKLPKE